LGGRLAGKTCFLTAAGQGMGRAAALAFAAEGARVIATDLSLAKLEDLRARKNIEIRPLDVTKNEEVERVAREVGAVDCLFNVAGFVHHGSILTSTEKEWDFAFDLNVKAMFRTIRAFLPAMIGKGGGSIINMASVAGSIAGIANRAAYGASKAAVIGLTKSVAIDYVRKGVRCNALAPGTVQTPSLDDRIAALGDPVKARAAFVARQPMGRLGTAEEMAQACIYLASDESKFMTGQVLIIDGGITLCGTPPSD
jgi:2-keto-3-deoxy-L-fuconate dehydrogenase